MASISRAFTKRTKRPEVSSPMPYHEGQIKFSAGTIKRGKISAPVQLISTTNMLALEAPELHGSSDLHQAIAMRETSSSTSSTSLTSSSSSTKLRDDSDMSESVPSLVSPITTPGASSREESPVEPTPLQGYLPKRPKTPVSSTESPAATSPRTPPPPGDDTPSVPKRALSHTKRSHQQVSRQRSLKAVSPPAPLSTSDSPSKQSDWLTEAVTAADAAAAAADPHPFGKELEKVREIAEEFGGGYLLDEEGQDLQRKGFRRFSVDEYLAEIEDLYSKMFDDDYAGPIPVTSWL